MKSRLILAMPAFVLFAGARAQMPITVSDDSLKIGNGLIPALSVTIPESDYDRTLKIWIRDLQAGTKSKVITENGEMSIFGAKFKSITANPLNVYSKLDRLDSMLVLTASFELKKDQYIDKSIGGPEYSKAIDYLKQFAKERYIEVAKNQADAEERKLRDLQKELSSLENEKSRMQRSIQSNNTSISDEKENITTQTAELNTVNASLAEQNGQLTGMEEGPARKEKSDQIKELEKRKKKAQNSLDASENRINRSNNEIDKANSDIPRNERMQEKVREQIDGQQALYQRYADKLKKIRSY